MVSKLAEDATPNMDDMYVPGLGVRNALFDDEVQSSFWLRTRKLRLLVLTRMRHSAAISSDFIRSTARQSMFIWNRVSREARISLNSIVALASLKSAAIHLQRREKRQTSATVPRGVLRPARIHLLRIRRITQIYQGAQWRLHMPQARTGLIRCWQRMRSSLGQLFASSQNLFRAMFSRRPYSRNSRFEVLSLPKLRRAAPALAILILVVVFVIQEVVMRVMQ